MPDSDIVKCFACGALVPNIEGVIHPYMLSAPGCWKLYGDILAKEYVTENYDADSHRVTVDTYAVTHPGNMQERKAVQSVNVHLIRLYYFFERNMRGKDLLELMNTISKDDTLHESFSWLKPPSFEATMHVNNILVANNFEEHKKLVIAWGKSVWDVWKNMHGSTIESLVKKVNIGA